MPELLFKPVKDLTFDSVPDESTRLMSILRDSKTVSKIVFDLSQVSRCDSAGLALLIDVKRLCKKHDKSLSFQGISDNIMALASFSGIEDVLAV